MGATRQARNSSCASQTKVRGVAAADRSRIFGRFQRGSTAGAREGTGLGLDLAQGLLRAMGGRVRLEPGDGPGATFAFTLPAELVCGPV